MKKNILLVPSLLTLSFVATTPLLGMDKTKPTSQGINYKEKTTSQGKNRKKRRQEAQNLQKKINGLEQELAKAKQQQLQSKPKQISEEKQQKQIAQTQNRLQATINELINSKIFLEKSQINNVGEVVANPLYNPETQTPSNLIQSETEVITLTLPEGTTNNNNNNHNTNNKFVDLGQSIMFPTEAKPLSTWETVKYTFTPSYKLLQETITALENNEFDVTDAGDFGRLYNAIETATYYEDIKSLDKITTLCYQNYPTTIRIPDKVAQPAAQLLNNHYSQEMTLTNDLLQRKHEEKIQQLNKETAICIASINNAINMYKQNIGFTNGSYNAVSDLQSKYATDLRGNFSKFALLNRSIRPEINDSLAKNKLQTPNNIHTNTMSVSAKQLDSILKITDNIATIKNSQKNPAYIARLTNTCLTNNK